MTRLGVNVDHIATLRQARQAIEPDPLVAALIAELAGADGITVHLRSDRRHIQEADVRRLRESLTTRLNLEMAVSEEMIQIAMEIGPDTVTLVPERRDELTTEGGLDLLSNVESVQAAVEELRLADRQVSLFLDPDPEQISKAAEIGVSLVELNTAAYSDAVPKGLVEEDSAFQAEFNKVEMSARVAASAGIQVLAGHGLTYRNVRPIASLPEVEELNIGHNVVARAALVGMRRAVQEMRQAMIG